MTEGTDSISALFDRAGAMAHERLREAWGNECVDQLLADPKSNVKVYFDLTRRRLVLMVLWPAKLGDEYQLPLVFSIPEIGN